MQISLIIHLSLPLNRHRLSRICVMLPPCITHYYITANTNVLLPTNKNQTNPIIISITTKLTCDFQTILVTPHKHNMTS